MKVDIEDLVITTRRKLELREAVYGAAIALAAQPTPSEVDRDFMKALERLRTAVHTAQNYMKSHD